jgi:hypothetical protein
VRSPLPEARPTPGAESTDTAEHRSPSRAASAPLLRTAAAALWVSGLVLLLSWTLINDAPRFQNDFWTDTWLIEHQAIALRADHAPSLFLHSGASMFYPVFAFYGGTLFAFAGAITVIVGSAIAAQVIVYILALLAAYGGWLWLARLAGLRSWPAHVPAVLYITAPYVLTNVYVRQDLAEVVATAAIPLFLAAALSILRSDELRAGPAAALAASAVALGGSHNLTLLWGFTVLSITGLVLVLVVPAARHLLTKRGVLRILAIAVPAMAVNAWYLLPDLAYHADTAIFHRVDAWKALLSGPNPAGSVKHLFALGRPSALPGADLSCTLPVLAIAWVILAMVLVRSAWREAWARLLAILSLATVILLVLISHPRLLLGLPDPWMMIQFSYRLETFVLFAICGAVIAVLVLLGPSQHRWLRWLLVPIVVLSIVGATRQTHTAARSETSVATNLDAFVTFGLGDYAGADLGQLSPRSQLQSLTLTRQLAHHNRVDLKVSARPGELVSTNLMTPSRMIDVQGARPVLRRATIPSYRNWRPVWYVMLKFDADATPGRAHIVIQEARSLPIVGGKIISLLGLLGLAANAAVIARAARRRRQARLAP